MEVTEREPLRTIRLSRALELRLDPGAFVCWLIPAVLVFYLALSNGGYDELERSEVGIAVWWMVLVGSLIGALPVAGGTPAGRAMFGLLGAFAVWNALSLGWTESAERTSTELARVAVYLGVFALALAAQGRGRWRFILGGVTTGMAAVCAIAVLSRLEPTWFPERLTEQYLPGIEIDRRLAYPLNYSSGLGAFAAIALPLILAATSSARSLAGQALAAAALPVVALTLWLTTSSLSVPAAVIALIAFFILAPDRLPKLVTLFTAGIGSAILFAAVEQRDALDRGLPTPQALLEGDELKTIILVVCVGVALVQVAVSLATRYANRPAWMRPSRSQATLVTAAVIAAIAIVGVAAGGAGEASDAFERFKSREGAIPSESSRGAQILDVSSSGRYDFWQSAVDAYETEPLTGIGPGTFEFWWAREGRYSGFTRDAHSLYFESLAELGLVGLVLIGSFVLAVLAIGTKRVLRAPDDLRLAIAAALAGCTAFAAAALVDWVWELAVIPVVFLTLAAIALAAGREASPPSRRAGAVARLGPRVLVGALALAALVAIAIPLARTSAVEESQAAFAQGDLPMALDRAADGRAIQPGAASPLTQQAYAFEASGDIDAAVGVIRKATANEPTNWRTWLVRSGIEARAGNASAAVDALREARRLNGTGAVESLAPKPLPTPEAP